MRTVINTAAIGHGRARFDEQLRIGGQINAVLRLADAQRPTQLARPIRQTCVRNITPLRPHPFHAFIGVNRPQQHRPRLRVALSYDVETMIHAVNEVDVGAPRRAIHDLAAPGAAIGM